MVNLSDAQCPSGKSEDNDILSSSLPSHAGTLMSRLQAFLPQMKEANQGKQFCQSAFHDNRNIFGFNFDADFSHRRCF
jgi:hypothetical protein